MFLATCLVCSMINFKCVISYFLITFSLNTTFQRKIVSPHLDIYYYWRGLPTYYFSVLIFTLHWTHVIRFCKTESFIPVSRYKHCV